jgi:hypothetical protein
MTTATATTAQKVNAILRNAGIPKSEAFETGPISGSGKRGYGYSVESHGVTTHTCTYCGKVNGHRAECISVTHRANVKTRQRKVNDGTFTVRLHQRYTMKTVPASPRTDADRIAIVVALTEAGLTVEQVDNDEWFIR